MKLPEFREGEEFRAEDLNLLVAALEGVERRARVFAHAGRRAVCDDDDERVYPWEVRDGGDCFFVRPGRVVVGFGTDCARRRLESGPVRHYDSPWSDQEWVEVAKGGAASGFVCLQVTGGWRHSRRGNAGPWKTQWAGDRWSEGAHSYRLTAGELPRGGQRVIALAAYNDEDEELTQLVWGDLDIFEVGGIQDAGGALLEPQAGLPTGWGEGATCELCALDFNTKVEEAHGTLKGCLDEYGGLEFHIGYLRGWTDVPPSFGDGLIDGGYYPVPDRGDDDGGGGRRRRRRRRRRRKPVDGYWYVGGAGIDVRWSRRRGGSDLVFDFLVSSAAELVATRELYYTAAADFATQNSAGRYDWPYAGQYDLQMYYGVSAAGTGLSVAWRSSYLGADTLPKSAHVEVGMPVVVGSCAPLLDGHFSLDSETGPAGLGNIILAVPAGYVTRTGTVREVDPLTGAVVRVRATRRYRRIRLVLNERKLLEIAGNKILEYAPLEAQVTPAVLSGHSDGIDGPDVRCTGAAVTQSEQPSGDTEVTGPLPVAWGVEYTEARQGIRASGSGAWNSDASGPTRFGSIDGVFEVVLPAMEDVYGV